jgi:TRAP-type C4-dicarboxylate transport system substrate-binding protein
MIDVPWAILTGATVVRKDVWERVPAEIRPRLIELARQFGKKVALEVRRMDTEALENMQKQGLVLVHADAAQFRKAAQSTYHVIRGKVVSAEVFDEVVRLVDEAHAKGIK